MARRNADGFIQLIDRKKNMIISGGENIYPTEVEAVLGACEAVKDVAVIGLPDDKWGETVHAVVVLHQGKTITAEDLLAWCENRIARFKRPRTISFVSDDQIPRTATGKVQHGELKQQILSRLSASEQSIGAKQ
jgi:acyl-CoA synthetase (AMP-forming)/AMP-acid ligase II